MMSGKKTLLLLLALAAADQHLILKPKDRVSMGLVEATPKHMAREEAMIVGDHELSTRYGRAWSLEAHAKNCTRE